MFLEELYIRTKLATTERSTINSNPWHCQPVPVPLRHQSSSLLVQTRVVATASLLRRSGTLASWLVLSGPSCLQTSDGLHFVKLRWLRAFVPPYRLTNVSSPPPAFGPLTTLAHPGHGGWLSGGLKIADWIELGKWGARHRGLEARHRGEGGGRPRRGHQPIARTRPRIKSPFSADAGVQFPQRSGVRSSRHYRSTEMASSPFSFSSIWTSIQG